MTFHCLFFLFLSASMVAYLDEGVGKIVDALTDSNMWEDTIWFCQSDNGGPSYAGDNHTANNFPLRKTDPRPSRGLSYICHADPCRSLSAVVLKPQAAPSTPIGRAESG